MKKLETKAPPRRRGGRSAGSGRSRRRGGRRRERSSRGGESAGPDGIFREIIVNQAPGQTRVAIQEDGALVEFMIERPEQRRTVGDIYMGKVTAVLPGIQAAFLDIGMERGAFLHVSDLAELDPTIDEALGIGEEEEERKSDRKRRDSRRRPIEEQLKKGDEFLVQVIKESIGTKGPRVTAQITIPGRSGTRANRP